MTRMPGQKAARFGEKGMRLVRSWETLLLLIESSAPLTAQEINQRIHRDYPFNDHPCSVQTTREDLKTLQKCGFPLCMADEHGVMIKPEELESSQGRLKNVRWQIRDTDLLGHLDNPHHRLPTSSDLVSLSLCRALLQEDLIPRIYPLYRLIHKLLDQLQLKVNQALRSGEPIIADLPGKIQFLGRRFVGKAINAEDWIIVTTAISRRQVLIGAYENRDGEKKPVEIAPLAVWFAEGRAYLLAAGAMDQKIRTWRLDRLSNLIVDVGRAAPEIDEGTVQGHIKSSFKGFVATPAVIRLHVKPQAAYLFHEFQYHPSQQITECADGCLEISMECSLGWGLEEWVLGFGELVTVLEPMELRESLRGRLQAAMAEYR